MDSRRPLITVNILTYNNFNYLEQTINSVFSQDYPNIELILSDDGSSNYDLDHIKTLVSKKPDKIKNLQIIRHEKNVGTVKNLNNCIKKANGIYFIGLSSDDLFYENNTISNVVDFFLKKDALIVTSRRLVCDESMQNEIQVLPTDSDLRYIIEDKDLLFERLCISNFISGACTFYSKKLFDKYGLFDERNSILEDYPYYLKLSRENETIHFYEGLTIKYRMGGVSTSGKVNAKLKEDSLNAIKNEILPFSKRINGELYRWKAFEYEFAISDRKINIRLLGKYPKEIILKALTKYKILNYTNKLIK